MSTRDAVGDGGVVTLADRLDDLLVTLELWRPRRRLLILLICLLVIAAGAGWFLSRPSAGAGLDELIPMADGAAPPADGGASGGASTMASQPDRQTERSAAEDEPGVPDAGTGDSAGDAAADVVVHVAGAVRRPGLVTLTPGSRISDAVTAAGGPTALADVHRLNLAAPVVDGMQVRVPLIDDETLPGELVQVPASDQTDPDSAGAVNINTASAERLQSLPGVGPAIAAAIVAWREEQGLFRSVDELDAVPGIGPAKLAALRDQIIV